MFDYGCHCQCNWLSGKTRLWNDLLCIEWTLNPTHSLTCTGSMLLLLLSSSSTCRSCYYSAPVEVWIIVINLYVCVSVCLSTSISLEALDRSAQNFVSRSHVSVARSSSGGVALRYVLPFYGRLHVWSYLVRCWKVEAALCSDGNEWRGDTGAESDVYECLLLLCS